MYGDSLRVQHISKDVPKYIKSCQGQKKRRDMGELSEAKVVQAANATPRMNPSRQNRTPSQTGLLPSQLQPQSGREHNSSQMSQIQPQYSSTSPSSSAAGFRSYASAFSSAPGSQDSAVSVGSGASTTGDRRVESSNNSVGTLDTALTSPTSVLASQQQHYSQQSDKLDESGNHLRVANRKSGDMGAQLNGRRIGTPDIQSKRVAPAGSQADAVSPRVLATSPTSLKRTASGVMKASGTVTPVGQGNAQSPVGHKRADSVSSSGSRAGDVSNFVLCVYMHGVASIFSVHTKV